MTNALAIQQRHLSLPDQCLFAPTELSIPAHLSQTEFSRLGKALSSVDTASDLWSCDYALAGLRKWGEEGLGLAAEATRLSARYLKVSARIAERFDPTRRYDGLTRNHYRGLVCFPVEFTDKWLPTVASKRLSAKSLRALAVEAYGSDPKAGYTKNRKRSISVSEALYARLKELSPVRKTAVFVEEVLQDFVSNATDEQKSRVAATLRKRDTVKHRERRRARAPEEAKPTKVEETPTPTSPKEPQPEARPTYSERRMAQIAAGVAPIPPKPKKKVAIRVQWLAECEKSFVEDSEGKVAPLRVTRQPTCFPSEEDAGKANEAFMESHGYREQVVYCAVCGAWHLKHVYSVDLPAHGVPVEQAAVGR